LFCVAWLEWSGLWKRDKKNYAVRRTVIFYY
jgi:hypothetical protein